MTKRRALPRALTLLAVASVVPLAACGDDEKTLSKVPAKLNITATESGKTVTVGVTGDKTPGTQEVTFTNNGKKPHAVQLIAVTGERSEAEVRKAYKDVGDSKPAPNWLYAAGGTGTTPPGKTNPVGLVFNEGTYWAVVETDAEDGNVGFTKFQVKGDKNIARLPTGATVTAKEYSFDPSGLKAGSNTVVFTNQGRQWHHMQAFPLNKGATSAQLRKFFESEGETSGPPPVDFENSVGTAVVEGGGTITSTLDFKKGKYALVCFIADRQGGKSHVAKGMINEVTID